MIDVQPYIDKLLICCRLKRNPENISKRNKLLNRKVSDVYGWGDFKRAVFSARLQILIDNCQTYSQYYRCQTLLKAYINKNGEWENDGWIFFGNKISITVRALQLRVNDIKEAIG